MSELIDYVRQQFPVCIQIFEEAAGNIGRFRSLCVCVILRHITHALTHAVETWTIEGKHVWAQYDCLV